ncbi:hypothetical protein [Arboricoccus pini]|nr:hypothetical protein [Arboricoccus pini]
MLFDSRTSLDAHKLVMLVPFSLSSQSLSHLLFLVVLRLLWGRPLLAEMP